ncbi:hypothetical protein EDB86DRAFT_2391297 [Lactarius hatsudake]|nr:hypothetical protein EDB86DRAFT_2391297 [Lactarius hatsudake]
MCRKAPKPSPSPLLRRDVSVCVVEIRISSSAGNAASWSSSMSHGGLSHSAHAWTMEISARRRRIRRAGGGFEFELPESVHANAHWSSHVVPVAAKLRGCKGWGGRRGRRGAAGTEAGSGSPAVHMWKGSSRTHLSAWRLHIRGGTHRLVRSS